MFVAVYELGDFKHFDPRFMWFSIPIRLVVGGLFLGAIQALYLKSLAPGWIAKMREMAQKAPADVA